MNELHFAKANSGKLIACVFVGERSLDFTIKQKAPTTFEVILEVDGTPHTKVTTRGKERSARDRARQMLRAYEREVMPW